MEFSGVEWLEGSLSVLEVNGASLLTVSQRCEGLNLALPKKNIKGSSEGEEVSSFIAFSHWLFSPFLAPAGQLITLT